MNQKKPQGKPIVFITGHSGMLGQKITELLGQKYQIHGLKRNKSSATNPRWNYRELLKELDIKAPDIVIHLAGAGIADKRWTKKYKKTIYDSRIVGTRWLVDEVMLFEQRPKAFLCASAIGYYGHRPEEILNETSESGNNFVAKIAKDWERATERLKDTETRLINLRFGMILSADGGALKDMLLPFKLGLGGRIGHGQQHYSWIAISDAVRAIEFLIIKTNSSGIYNLTAPESVTNRTFTSTLAKTLKRPAFIPMPELMARLVFGEVADELLLADANVKPQRLIDAGFEFEYPQLDSAFQALLS